MRTKVIHPLPSQQLLRELFDYDPDTGVFTYLTSGPGRKGVGCEAGCHHKNTNRCVIYVQGQSYPRSRLAVMWMTGNDPGPLYVDHINRDRMDDRWCNLRVVTPSDNTINTADKPSKYGKFVYYKPVRGHDYYAVIIRQQSLRVNKSFHTLREAQDYAEQFQ